MAAPTFQAQRPAALVSRRMVASDRSLSMSKPPRRFVLLCSRASFSPPELLLLERYGCMFEDLVAGRRPCRTAEQRRFVEVAKRLRRPKTYYECLWRKYLACVEMERPLLSPSPRAAHVVPRKVVCHVPRGGARPTKETPRYRTVADLSPTLGPADNVRNDRDDWKRMRARQWGDAMRQGFE